MSGALFPDYADGDHVLVGKFGEPAEVVGDPWRDRDDWMYPLHVGPTDGGYSITLAGRFLQPALTNEAKEQ